MSPVKPAVLWLSALALCTLAWRPGPAQGNGRRGATGVARAPYAATIPARRIRATVGSLRSVSRKNAARARRVLAPRLGGRAAYDERVARIARTQRVEIRLPVQALEGFLRDGYYKTYQEADSNRGGFRRMDDRYRRYRALSEQTIGAEDHRVVYGSLTHDLESSRKALLYGTVVLILRPDRIRNRTTFTPGDLMDITVASGNPPPGMKAYRRHLSTWEHRHHLPLRTGDVYIEAQIRGGITVEDVAAVELPRPRRGSTPVYDRLVRAIRQSGLPVVHPDQWHTGHESQPGSDRTPP